MLRASSKLCGLVAPKCAICISRHLGIMPSMRTHTVYTYPCCLTFVWHLSLSFLAHVSSASRPCLKLSPMHAYGKIAFAHRAGSHIKRAARWIISLYKVAYRDIAQLPWIQPHILKNINGVEIVVAKYLHHIICVFSIGNTHNRQCSGMGSKKVCTCLQMLG